MMIRTVLVLLCILLAFPATAREKFLDIREIKTPKGLTVWLIEDPALPMIAVQFGFRGAGAVNDPIGKQGTARLLSNTLDEGAGSYDSTAFQKALEDNSISLSFSAGRDHFTGSLKTLTETKDKAFELLHLALTEPRFDDEAVKRMIAVNENRIRSDRTDPDWMATRIRNDKAFSGHPYARNSGGTMTTLPALTADDLRSFYKNYLTGDRLVIGVVGDITVEEVMQIVDEVFSDLPVMTGQNFLTDSPLQNTGKTFVYDNDAPQTVLSLALPAVKRDDPAYAAATVMNHIFGGGGFGSRLTDTIREKAGLTYGIYSGLENLDYADLLSIGTSTRNDRVPEMMSAIKAEMEKIKEKGVTPKELAEAKSYLLGSMPAALTSTDRIAAILLNQQLDARPIDDLDTYRAQIAAVTQNDVQKQAQRLLDVSKAMVVLVGRPTGMTGAEKVNALPDVE